MDAATLPALLVSDIHLSPNSPQTHATFLRFLYEVAPAYRSLYLLGDIFEYWPGDDIVTESPTPEFYLAVIAAFARLRMHKVKVFWLDGNRDFLIGAKFLSQINAERLVDPYLFTIKTNKSANGEKMTRFFLTHGDQFCAANTNYMAYRPCVRNVAFVTMFLSQTMPNRLRLIETIRQHSDGVREISDVSEKSMNHLFQLFDVNHLIHGHTHLSACHAIDEGRQRWVLSDWSFDVEAESKNYARTAKFPRANAVQIDAKAGVAFLDLVHLIPR